VLCCCVAAAQPHMTCTTHDLPAVHDAAVQYVQQQGLTDRVKVRCSHVHDKASMASGQLHIYGRGAVMHEIYV
jgi:hypothetical protein